MLALVGVQAALTVFLLSRVAEQSAQLVEPALDRTDNLAHAEADLLRLRTLEYSSIWAVDSDVVRQQYAMDMASLQTDIGQHLQAYSAETSDPIMLAALAELRRSYAGYLASQRKSAAFLAQGSQDQALWEYLRFQPSFLNLDGEFHDLRHREYQATESLRDQIIQTAVWARWPLGLVVVLVAAGEVGLGWRLSRRISASLDALLAGAHRIEREDFGQPVPCPPEPELAALANTLNAVMIALATHNAERARLAEERQDLARTRLYQSVQAQEEERARVSRELHDQAGQALTALRYGLIRLRRQTADEKLSREIDRLIELAGVTTRQIGSLARDLRPSVLDDLGLGPALRSYTRDFSERFGVPVQCVLRAQLPRLISPAETAVFRVVQEALTNVAKHAHARHAWVDGWVEGDELQLQVRDDGQGFDPLTVELGSGVNHGAQAGLGLIGIRERVELLGGRLEIVSEPGAGTTLRARIPLLDNTAEDSRTRPDEVSVA